MVPGPQSQVLITGGTSGIGRGLAERFVRAGATVLVTGRDPDRLSRMQTMHPSLRTIASDIGIAAERERLARHVAETIPGLNVVINNAGIQRRVSLAEDRAPWAIRQAEIDILLAGPVHLNALLLPMMLGSGAPGRIVNVTSGGAYVPQPFAPLYAACKAALHSYTVTLRHALRDTAVRVVELIPPAVATGLAGPGADHGAPLDAFCDAVFPQIASGDAPEIGFGLTATEAFRDAAEPYRALFETFSSRFHVRSYGEPQPAEAATGARRTDEAAAVAVDHSGFAVASLAEAIRFWTEVLGFTLERQGRMGGDFLRHVTGVADPEVKTAIVRAPDGHAVELLEYSGGRDHGLAPASAAAIGAAHLALTVRDMAAAVRRIEAAGWSINGSPQPIPGGPRKGTLVVYLSGPDNITIELMQSSG